MILKKKYNGKNYSISYSWNGSISWNEVYIYRNILPFLSFPVYSCNQEYTDVVKGMLPETMERKLNAAWDQFVKYNDSWKEWNKKK